MLRAFVYTRKRLPLRGSTETTLLGFLPRAPTVVSARAAPEETADFCRTRAMSTSQVFQRGDTRSLSGVVDMLGHEEVEMLADESTAARLS